jgi:GntR family transcriptional regulator
MPTPQVPKYQAIYALLRQQILAGEFAAGSRLPAQQELADTFGVTLMTLRQAVSALEADGLVWAARGKGTFVSDRPVDISIGNLSSFAQEMRAAGIEMVTELLDVATVAAGRHDAATGALAIEGDLRRLTRRRSAGGEPFSLQRSYLAADVDVDLADVEALGQSLYGAIEKATGWIIAEASESVSAVSLGAEDASLLSAPEGHPALLSIRTSINQFDMPYLYDEALLVGGRCSIAANRSAERLSLNYRVDQG